MVTRKLNREKGPKMSEILECSACGQTTADGLELTPSGKQFKRHKDGQEVCTGGKPQSHDPEPVKVVPAGTPAKIAECVECGEELPVLKSGKVRKHTNPQTLATCEQRPSVEAECPVCQGNRQLKKMRFPVHKDMRAGTRCPASAKTVAEAQALEKVAPPKGKTTKAATPAVPKARKDDGYKALSPLDKSKAKAKKLGEELKALPDNPWRYKIETGQETQDPDQATLILTRGTGKNLEEMGISWWGGACYGGDLRIFHTYRGRTIAVRNANAVRMRAAMTPEAVAAEYARVSTRKSAPRAPRTAKTPEQLRELMPFDPKTADDDAILKAVLNRTVRWENKTAGKTETDVVKGNPKIAVTKAGARNLTFKGLNTTRTVRVENLVSVS